jgi:ADP-ribose pyrophosphatase YjhB (NUDIX family)
VTDDEPRFTVAAYAIVTRDGKVLLTRRRESDEWVLPGGSVEEEEPPWDAAVREVREETGLEVTLERLAGVYAKRRERDLVFVVAASPSGGELRTSRERDRVEYFDPAALPDGTSDRDRERIADALDEPNRTVMAVQRSAGPEPPSGTR